LHKHRIEKVLVVAGDHELKGMITVKDFRRRRNFRTPARTRSEPARWSGGGTTPDTLERVAALRDAASTSWWSTLRTVTRAVCSTQLPGSRSNMQIFR